MPGSSTDCMGSGAFRVTTYRLSPVLSAGYTVASPEPTANPSSR